MILKSIHARNFQSYETIDIDGLDKFRNIEVVGENGNGKSALMEAVPFALYGEGRESTAELIREGGDKLEVSVEFVVGKKIIRVERARRVDAASGSAALYVDDQLEAKGSEVVRRLYELSGTDYDSFLLTSFFGMNANDSLMTALPSARLEMLQSLAKANVFKTLADSVSEKRAEVRSEREVALSFMESRVELSCNEDTIATKRTRLTAIDNKIADLTSKVAKMSVDIDRLNLFVQEKTKLTTKQSSLLSRKTEYTDEARDLELEIKQLKDSLSALKKKEAELKGSLANVDYQALDDKISKLQQQIVETNQLITMKSLGSSMKIKDDVPHCPLCNHDLEKKVVYVWTDDIRKGREEVAFLQKALEEANANKDKLYGAPSRELGKLTSKISLATTELETKRSRLDEVRGEAKTLTASLAKIEQRLSVLKTQNKDSDASIASMNQLNDQISELKAEAGELKADIQHQTEVKAATKKQDERAKQARRTLKSTKEALADLDILSDAFGRYGIPLSLIKGIRTQIEKRATIFCRTFSGGRIEIRDVEEKGRPGINYILHTDTGSRTYSQLSKGQKVLLYLPVRLAIADLLHHSQANHFGFLVLDEVTSHLDEPNRERLAELIMTSLSKMYGQIFLMSHSSIRHIFDCTIKVNKVDGKSVAVVE